MSSSRLLFQNRFSSLSNLSFKTHHIHKQLLYHTQHRSIIFSLSQHRLNNQLFHYQHHKSFCTKPPLPTTNEETPNENASEHEQEEGEEEDSEWEYREYDKEQMKQKNYQVLTWKTVIGTIIFFGIGTIFFQQRIHRHRQKQKQPQYASFGEAQIGGGEWKMTDHHNVEINEKSLLGKYQIVYFGFVFCPDVCPRELTKMSHVCSLLQCFTKVKFL